LIEISFPDENAARAAELVQEFRQALLRNGAQPDSIVLGRSDPQAMSLADYVTIGQNIGHFLVLGLTAVHVAQLACEVCFPAKAGILIKTLEGKEFRLSADEIDVNRLTAILSAAGSDEHRG